MGSCQTYTMDIPEALRDTHTWIPNHSAIHHAGCVLLRCALGVYFLTGTDDISENETYWWMFFGLLTCCFFTYKLVITGNTTWKVYARTILVYALVSVLMFHGKRDAAGVLILVDALMGLQSRHIATWISP